MDEIIDTFDPDEKVFDIVGRGSKVPLTESPDLLRLRLKTARERIFREYFQVGNDLFQVLHNDLWLKWEYESFGAYVDSEVGLSLKYAMNYIRVFTKFNKDLGLRPEQLEGIGVTKALALTDKVVTRDNAEDWIEKAKNTTTTELRDKIKLCRPTRFKAVPRNSPEAEIGLVKSRMEESLLLDDPNEPPVAKTFYLYPKQLDFVETTLSIMPRRTNSDKEGHNLTQLCLEHQSHRAEVGDKTERRPYTILNGFEASFGGIVRWFKTREQAKAVLEFMDNNPNIFKESEND